MTNAELLPAVRAELERMGVLPGVEARWADGIVTLSGTVADLALSRRVEQRLLALPEVMDVHNYLGISPPCDHLRDQFLARLAQDGVAVGDLQVAIKDAVVTLSGSASSWFDRDVMSRAAWTLPGVREVVNRVTLPPGAVQPDTDETGNPLP